MRPTLGRFLDTLALLRWDDHRYYHHSRINQSLHFVSALSFLAAYGMLFIDPAWAAWIAWTVSMTTRQAGHFFFEPRGYDHVNQATDAHKEEIKVGYNIRRKVVLMAIWVAAPLALWLSPTLGGTIAPATDFTGYLRDVGMAWLALGVAGLVFRTLQLFFVRDPVTALAWATKIVTDPFHDAMLYRHAPLALLKGELIDPMEHVLEQRPRPRSAAGD
ncbi:MAG: DUF962 domain-containing protein [Rubrivivax sp.]|jgi:hypothetical protein|nr:DUF962 domain-containing protein [Rubrivivax sp.]